ncbi:hypothetical protein FQN54_000338 [Arachnomyces sp. PD_36]|nr:hypothetical protein FQN54_000338 [Arachnomyces sp. PD_36]
MGTILYSNICDSADLGSIPQAVGLGGLVQHVQEVGINCFVSNSDKSYHVVEWTVVPDDDLHDWCTVFKATFKEALKLRAVYPQKKHENRVL